MYYVYTMFDRLSKERLNMPKTLTDAQYGSHGYLSVKGVKIHYMERGDKTKPLLLFVHGFPEFWYSWRYQLLEFSNDYWCVAMDLRGYGFSDKPEGVKDYAIDVVVDEIKDFVQLLGKDRFTIVGHDWGTLLASVFVDKYGNMLEKFILMSAPSPDIYAKLLWSDMSQFKKSWYIFLFAVPYIPECIIRLKDFEMLSKSMGGHSPQFVSEDDIEAYKYTFSKVGALTWPLRYYRCELLYSTQKQIKVPVNQNLPGMFILGEKDPYISKACVPLMEQKYKGLKVELLKDAYHFIQQEKPEEINKLMREFLAK